MTNIDHLIGKDGTLKPGVLLTPSEYLAAAQRGLKSVTGQSLKLIEPTPDPMSARILRTQAPPEITSALEQANTKLAEAQTLVGKFFDSWGAAKTAKRKFIAEYGGSELTESGIKQSDELDRAITESEKNLADAEDCATLARVGVMEAEQRLSEWIRDRRREIESGSAQQIANVDDATVDKSIAARLRRLKDIVTS